MELLPVISLLGGVVLMYGAVKNKNPIGVIQAALTGKDLNSVPPLMQDSSSPLPGTIPVDKLPGTPQADGDARTDGQLGQDTPNPNPLGLPDWLIPKPRTSVDPRAGGGQTGNGAL